MRALRLLLLGLACVAAAAGPMAEAPVQPGSPAWQALAALPLREGSTLNHGAAELLVQWRRPDEADALRRRLLALHWQACGDPSVLPPPGETLERWLRSEAPAPSVDALADAWRRAMSACLRAEPIRERPPADHIALDPVAAVPGLWKPERHGYGLGMWRLTNTGSLALALQPLAVGLQWGTTVVPARCGLTRREPLLAPGASADWACALDAPLPPEASGQPRWHWSPPSLVSEADRRAQAQRLQPQSTALSKLQLRHAGCESQGNCSEAQRRALAEAADAREQAASTAAAALQTAQQEQRLRERREQKLKTLGLIAALIGGQALFVLLARASGSLWPGRALVMAGAAWLSLLLLREAGESSRDSFAPLVLAMAGVGAIGAGLLLCAVYGFVYQRFFEHERQPSIPARRARPAPTPTPAPVAAPLPAPAPVAAPAPRLSCPHCVSPFAHLRLQGHYGAEVQLDHCDACRLLWFDNGELGRLSGRGWTALLHRLVDGAERATPQPARADAACPHCQTRLQAVHDQTLFGRFVGQACPRGHGSAQRDAALFAARGLFRRPHALETAGLKGEAAACLACGAAREPDAGDCRYCGSPPLVVDLKRLAQSLGLQERRSTLGQGQGLLWACAGCGQSLDAAAHSSCPQCTHPVVALRIEALRPLLEAALARPAITPAELQAARQAQAEVLIAHERMKVDWQREARPRSPVMVMLLGLVRLLGRRD